MNKFARTQQWCTFARRWLLYDAKWQDAFYSADLIAGYLKGQFKPIYDNDTKVDLGDVVVVINTKGKPELNVSFFYFSLFGS